MMLQLKFHSITIMVLQHDILSLMIIFLTIRYKIKFQHNYRTERTED